LLYKNTACRIETLRPGAPPSIEAARFKLILRTRQAFEGLKAGGTEHLARLLLLFGEASGYVHWYEIRVRDAALRRRNGKQGNMALTEVITDLIDVGIRAENLRQKAIASNIANMQTPGYRRVDVRFEEMLDKALNSGGKIKLAEIDPEVYQPMETAVKSNGNDVSLEKEVGEMVKNTLRHKAYIRLLRKKYAQIELAINIKQ
jgi:flagellar basal-body rod protein FlgB